MKKHNNEQAAAPSPLNVERHTPGEWEIVTDLAQLFPDEIFIAVKNDRGILEHPICDVFLTNNKDGKANARLIASAPSLLKENEQLKEQVRVLREATQKLLGCITEDFSTVWSKLEEGIDDEDVEEIQAAVDRINEALSQTETKVN